MSFVYKSDPVRGAAWAEHFAQRMPDLAFHIWPATGDPRQVRYLAAWEPPEDLAERFPNLEILFSTGAGVDQFDFSSLPEHLPVVRMVEPGIAQGMAEYATLAVLSIHRDWQSYADQQRAKVWRPLAVLPASSRRVGVLGLGVLAQAVLQHLAPFGFQCAGWSRSQQSIEGIECFAGTDGLRSFLARTDILVCLLPLTDSTRGILSESLFRQLPRGAAVINTGRGGHLVQEDLIRALDTGHLSQAVLDVCEPEPPPPEHPFWTHPKVRMTPHVASVTHPGTAVDVVIDNLLRFREGRPMLGLVDRAHGY